MACWQPFTDLRVGVTDHKTCCPPWLDERAYVNEYVLDPWELWNHDRVVALRRAVLEGSYLQYCQSCTRLRENAIETAVEPWMTPVMHRPPQRLYFESDHSCQLACPTCRPHIHKRSRQIQLRRDRQAWRIANEFLPTATVVNLLQSGDPFVSPFSRDLLSWIGEEPTLTPQLEIFTNGLRMPLVWPQFQGCHALLSMLYLSVDAATQSTYEKVRQPGKWSDLVASLKYVSVLKHRFDFKWQLNFVVQAANFREIPAFIEMASAYGADFCHLARVGFVYESMPLLSMDICRSDHPEHGELLEVLAHPSLRDSRVLCGTLWPLMNDRKSTVAIS